MMLMRNLDAGHFLTDAGLIDLDAPHRGNGPDARFQKPRGPLDRAAKAKAPRAFLECRQIGVENLRDNFGAYQFHDRTSLPPIVGLCTGYTQRAMGGGISRLSHSVYRMHFDTIAGVSRNVGSPRPPINTNCQNGAGQNRSLYKNIQAANATTASGIPINPPTSASIVCCVESSGFLENRVEDSSQNPASSFLNNERRAA